MQSCEQLLAINLFESLVYWLVMLVMTVLMAMIEKSGVESYPHTPPLASSRAPLREGDYTLL